MNLDLSKPEIDYYLVDVAAVVVVVVVDDGIVVADGQKYRNREQNENYFPLVEHSHPPRRVEKIMTPY